MTITKTCLEGKGSIVPVGQRAYVSDLVPYAWYRQVTTCLGKHSCSANVILSELVDFYRFGVNLGGDVYTMFLASTKSSLNYQYFPHNFHRKFNLTYSQVKEALIKFDKYYAVKGGMQ